MRPEIVHHVQTFACAFDYIMRARIQQSLRAGDDIVLFSGSRRIPFIQSQASFVSGARDADGPHAGIEAFRDIARSVANFNHRPKRTDLQPDGIQITHPPRQTRPPPGTSCGQTAQSGAKPCRRAMSIRQSSIGRV